MLKCECGGLIMANITPPQSKLIYDCITCGKVFHRTNTSNCFCVGHHAGEYITTDSNIIILGDDIPDHNNPPEWALVWDHLPNYKILIGPTIGRERNELYYSLKDKRED
jgi:hypothetical protein